MENKITIANFTIRDLALIMFFSAPQFDNLFTKLLGSSAGKSVLLVAFFVVYILAIYDEIKYDNGKGIAKFLYIFLFTQIIFIISYVINPDLLTWFTHQNWGLQVRFYPLTSGFYALLVILLVREPERILDDLKVVVLIRFAHGLLEYLNFVRRGGWLLVQNDGITEKLYDYNMGFGYSMTFIALVCCIIFCLKKDWIFFFIGFVATSLSILYGSRGVIIVYAVFVFLYFLQLEKENKIRALHYSFQVSILLLGFLIFYFKGIHLTLFLTILISTGLFSVEYYVLRKKTYKDILLISQIFCLGIIATLLTGYFMLDYGGMSTGFRNVDKLLSFSFMKANGRDSIWLSSFQGIKSLFPFGGGAFGDRLYVDSRFQWGYSHNIFLEMTLSFGIIGLLFTTFVFLKAINNFLNKKFDVNYRFILLVFISMCTKLLISDSFWYSMEFWGLVSLLIVGRYYQLDKREIRIHEQ